MPHALRGGVNNYCAIGEWNPRPLVPKARINIFQWLEYAVANEELIRQPGQRRAQYRHRLAA